MIRSGSSYLAKPGLYLDRAIRFARGGELTPANFDWQSLEFRFHQYVPEAFAATATRFSQAPLGNRALLEQTDL